MFKTKISKIIFFPLSFSFYFLFFVNALAQFDLPPPRVFKIGEAIESVACFLITAILIIMIIVLLLSGMKFLTSRGNEQVVAEAKKRFLWTLVGIAVILGSNVIIATIGAFVTGGSFIFSGIDCISTYNPLPVGGF